MDKLRIGTLPSGLELWISEEEGAYTVPPRSGTDEVQQTLTQVDLWSRTQRPGVDLMLYIGVKLREQPVVAGEVSTL